VIFITLIAAVIASLSQILYKKGMGKAPIKGVIGLLNALRTKMIILGLGGYFISLVIYLYALAGAPLSLVYPIFASTFIFTVLFSAKFLNEQISARRIMGLALIFVGIVIVAVYTL